MGFVNTCSHQVTLHLSFASNKVQSFTWACLAPATWHQINICLWKQKIWSAFPWFKMKITTASISVSNILSFRSDYFTSVYLMLDELIIYKVGYFLQILCFAIDQWSWLPTHPYLNPKTKGKYIFMKPESQRDEQHMCVTTHNISHHGGAALNQSLQRWDIVFSFPFHHLAFDIRLGHHPQQQHCGPPVREAPRYPLTQTHRRERATGYAKSEPCITSPHTHSNFAIGAVL